VRVIYAVALVGGELRDEAIGTTDQAQWYDVRKLDDVNIADYARRAIHSALEK
jgi:hypothetical protein